MKKLTLLIAALVLSFTAQAVTHNVSSSFSWWVAGSDSPVQAGDTLLVADGEYVEQWSIDFQKSDLVVMAAEGAKPVIKASSYLKIHATTTFEGITFDGLNTATYAIGSRGTEEKNLTLKNCEFKNYVDCDINIYESTSINKLTIDSCVFDGTNTTPIAIYGKGSTSELTITNSEFKNYTEYCITANDYYKGYFEKVSISNSLFHDSKYSAIYLYQADEGDPQSCTDFQLTNSTIYNIGNNPTETDLPKRAVVDIRGNSTQQVLVDHVTIYNFPTPDYCGAIKIENSSNATISNCIVMNPDDIYTKWITPFLAYAGATISNSVYYNCNITSSATATQEDLTQADPMFVDAANADFMLYAESPAVGMGDPRWGVKAGLQPGNGILSGAVATAQAGDTIVLGDGEYIEQWSFAFDKEGLVVIAAEDAKPVIKASSYMQHYATTAFIGITFDGQDVAEYTTYSYETDTEKDLTFINCEFKGYTKSCVTLGSAANVNKLLVDGCTFDGGSKTPAAIKSSGIISACDIKDSEIKGYTEYGFVANSSSAHTEELSIDNTIIHDCGASAIYVTAAADGKDKQSCSSFELTNSTIYNIGNNTKDHGAVDIRDNANITSAQQVLIDHVTLYNFNTKDWYGGFMIYQSANATISNCIVSNPADLSGKNGYHVYGNAVVTNSLYHNCNITSGAQQTANIEADPLFVDAANANFMLSANSPAVGKGTDGSNLGDTRWGVSASLKGKVINIEPGTGNLNSAVGHSVSAGDTIVLADGTYDEPYAFDFDVEGLVVMAAEGATPVVELSNADGWTTFTLSATTTFDGIIFDGKTVCKSMLQTNATDISKLAFYNCEFRNYAKYAISNPDAGGTHVDSVIIDNCLFHDGAGSAVNFNNKAPEGTHACSYFKMTNSSVYNIGSSANAAITIRANGDATGAQNKVIIDHITLYNYATSEYGGIAIRKTNDLQITNSIIANPSAGLTAIYHYSEVQNNLFHNVTLKASDGASYNAACITADPLFVDAANNNFKLKANSPAIGKATDGSNLGDPRWGVEGPQVINLTTGDNSAVIAANIGKTVNVKIERSFTANDGYYTLCVPFDIDASEIGTAYKLDAITKHVSGNEGGININLTSVSTIEAGVPYLVLPKTLANPIFENVIIENTTGSDYTITGAGVKVTFTGIINGVGEQTNGTTEYYVGNNGYLYKEVVEKRGLCGLFTITDENGAPVNVRARVVTREEVETGLDNNQMPNTHIQKVLENGQLIIIRDGVKYNVQGQVIK